MENEKKDTKKGTSISSLFADYVIFIQYLFPTNRGHYNIHKMQSAFL